MNITLEYNGYVGSVVFSELDRIFYGKVKGSCKIYCVNSEKVV